MVSSETAKPVNIICRHYSTREFVTIFKLSSKRFKEQKKKGNRVIPLVIGDSRERN